MREREGRAKAKHSLKHVRCCAAAGQLASSLLSFPFRSNLLPFSEKSFIILLFYIYGAVQEKRFGTYVRTESTDSVFN